MTFTLSSYRFGRFEFRPAQRQLLVDGHAAGVGARAFDMLQALIERRDRVVSRDELFELVWPGLIVEENNIRQHVSALRKLLGAAAVVTVPGRGYRFGLTLEDASMSLAGSVPPGWSVPAGRIGVPDNLPVNRPALIGRETQLADVIELLAGTHLLTLVGAGGVGKTSFALEVADMVRGGYDDGVCFVELAAVTDPMLVPRTMASALDIHEEPGRPVIDTLLDFFRSRKLLIVLDNCEHLIDSCARLAEQVLRGSAGTRTLATSREALGIAGEVAWRMPSLQAADPDADWSVEQLGGYAATRLFVQRAVAASATFRLTAENAAAVARICHQLDGIPLALELAAARVQAMRVEQVAERLRDRFALLTRGSRTALQRHQTLRSMIDWSHDLLSESERLLLRRLSVFAGGWSLEAAEAVCSDHRLATGEVMDLLAYLVEKSLVLIDDHATEPRYRMLETIRQYAREKFAGPLDAQQVRDRHLAYVLSFARDAEPNFYRPEQLRWYARIDADLDNVRAALEWSLTRERAHVGMSLATALHRYWVARLYWREAVGWLERLLVRPASEPQDLVRARAFFVSGHIANYYDPMAGLRLTEEALRMSKVLDDTAGIANALWVMGWINASRLDGSATPYFDESIRLATAIDNAFAAVHAYAWCGMYKVGMGEYESAKPLLLAGIDWAHRLGGDASLIGRCKGNLGQAEMLQGHFAQARAYLDESLALTIKSGNQNGRAESLWLQGRLALAEGSVDGAVRFFNQSLELYRPYASSLWVTRGLAYLTIAFAASDRMPLAARLAGFLSARHGSAGRLEAELGSLAAIAEYETAVVHIRGSVLRLGLGGAWAEGTRLSDDAAIALALDATKGE